MFGRRIKLFTVFGFEVGIDLSWFIIAILVTWSLAEGLFPAFFQGERALAPLALWLMGIAGALGLFISIVLHELAHSLVARRYGLVMRGITLFVFGGVAEMGEEPPSPEAELMIAIAGPIESAVLGICFVLVGFLPWPDPVKGVIFYLGFINLALVAFNMIPAFPLDGGRVLRSLLWAWKGNLRSATRITSRLGAWFGLGLIGLAVLHVLLGNFVAGIWWFLLGMFLRSAAQMSYRQLLVRRSLEGEPVQRFMQTELRTVGPDVTVDQLVEEYVYRYHFKMFPVVDNGRLLGCITTREIRVLPRERWSEVTVGEAATPCSDRNTIGPGADATVALARMNQTGASRLMVVEGDRLVGVIALKDLLRFISLKVELEEES